MPGANHAPPCRHEVAVHDSLKRDKVLLLTRCWSRRSTIAGQLSLRPPLSPNCLCGILDAQTLLTGKTFTAMYSKSGIIDANVLVYAMDEFSPHCGASRTLLDAARDGSTALYFTPQMAGLASPTPWHRRTRIRSADYRGHASQRCPTDLYFQC